MTLDDGIDPTDISQVDARLRQEEEDKALLRETDPREYVRRYEAPEKTFLQRLFGL